MSSEEKRFKQIEKQLESTEARYKKQLICLQKKADDVQAKQSEYLESTQRKTAQAQSRKDKAHQLKVTELEQKISQLQGSISAERDEQRVYQRDGDLARDRIIPLQGYLSVRLSAFPDYPRNPPPSAWDRTDSSEAKSKSSKEKGRGNET